MRATGLLALSVALCGRAQMTGDKVVLQLDYSHQFEFAGIYAARFKGYFAQEGLNVEIRPGSMDARPARELTEGRADYGTGAATMLLHRLNGSPLVLVSTIYQHSMLAIMVRAESDIRSPEDLRGKRLATSGRHAEISAMFDAEGVPMSEIVVVPDEWQVNEIMTGAADAQTVFINDVPFDLQRQGVAVRLIRPQDYGVDFYGGALFTSERVLRERPDQVVAMRRAVLRGWEYALAHPEEVISHILETYYPNGDARVSRERLRFEAVRVARQINAELLDLGHVNPQRWRRVAETYVRLGLAKDMERFEGFISPASLTLDRGIPSWLLWGAAGVLVLAGLALLANRRLQRLVERRTVELRESERRQREIFDLAPVPIVVEDVSALAARLSELRASGVSDLPQHLAAHPGLTEELFKLKRLVDANRCALETTGFPDLATMNSRLREVMTPQAMEGFDSELHAIWNGDEALVLEKLYRATNGKVLTMLFSWSVNRVAGVLDYSQVRIVFADISSIKAAERALHESEERYRRLFETTPNPVYIFDAETLRFQMVNTAAVQRYGFTPEEFAQMTVIDIRPADERERLMQEMEAYRAGAAAHKGPRSVGVWRHRCKDGTIIIVEIFTHTIEFNGRQCVLSLPFDITAKLATERALRDSEARYRELVENAAVGVYRATAEGRFISVNPAMARLYGFESPEQMLEWNERENRGTAFVDESELRRFLELVRRQGRVEHFESRIVDRHGNTLWLAETSRAVCDADGVLVYIEGFVTDITARRRLQEEMQRASKLESVGILAGGIAHDFNNILTVVLGNLTLASTAPVIDAGTRKLLQDAQKAVLRARDLTQQLLTFAKGGDPIRTTIALPEILREAARFGMHGSNSRLELECEDDLWAVEADKGQIAQVVQNLVINAVHAMPDGGVVRIVAGNASIAKPGFVGDLAPGDFVKISVADSGVGIPPELLSKIFDPYFTTKTQGSGLGLATVYSILKKHQGHIEVRSTVGAGTVFDLWLPAAAEQLKAEPPAQTVVDAPLRIRVLFMDDEEAICEVASLYVTHFGGELVAVPDGATALREYEAARKAGRPFDVVIMDLTIPGGMGGREAMEKLLVIDPEVRAIVSSGYSSNPVLANYRKHGFCGVLPKPYTLEQLRRALDQAADRSAKG